MPSAPNESERSFVCADREELIFLLCEAAEFEHAVMCCYLYTMWSLKAPSDSGFNSHQSKLVENWRVRLRDVAVEEMLHLTLAQNLLAALGAGPHLRRPPFPVPRGFFPGAVDMHLRSFCIDSLQHFMFLERPAGLEIPDGKGFIHLDAYHRKMPVGRLMPAAQDYETQGHLYYGIAKGMDSLANSMGEKTLFCGDPKVQVNTDIFPLPGLFAIDSLESAHKAIEEIVLQGEGAPADNPNSHFALFKMIHDEFEEESKADSNFAPAYAVVENPVMSPVPWAPNAKILSHIPTRKAVDLGNAVYTLATRALAQVFAPTPLPPQERMTMATASLRLMHKLTDIGELVCRLPVDTGNEASLAGLNFELPRSFGLLSNNSAMEIIGERAAELARAAAKTDDLSQTVSEELEEMAARLRGNKKSESTKISSKGGVQSEPSSSGVENPLVEKAERENFTLYFEGRRCIHSRRCVLAGPDVFLANVQGPWLHPENESIENLVAIAHNCPSGAVMYDRKDGGPAESAPKVNRVKTWENGPNAFHGNLHIQGEDPRCRATLCRCGKSRQKPYCDGTHKEAGFTATGEASTQESPMLTNRGGVLNIEPIKDGPLQLTGNLEVCAGTGRTIRRVEATRFCRCGGSSNKPFCDGTHAKIDFRSDN